MISHLGNLWDVQTGTQIGGFRRSGMIRRIRSDGRYIIDAEYLGPRPHGRLNIIEITTGDIIYSVEEDLSIVDIALNSGNTFLGYILGDKKTAKIVFREFPSGNLIRETNFENENIEYERLVAIDEKTFTVSISSEYPARAGADIRDVSTGNIINNLPRDKRYVERNDSVRSYVSKSNVLAVSYNSWIDIYVAGKKIHELTFDLNRAPRILDISPDGSLIATYILGYGAINFYDTQTGVVVKTIEGTGSSVNTGIFSGRWFISATVADAGLIFVWNIYAPGIPRIVNTITSNSHPGPDLWYQNSHLLFTWTPPIIDPFGVLIPDQVVGYYVLLDRNPNTVPTASTGDLVFGLETDYPNTPDGIWHFHLAIQLPSGDVPPVAIHRQVKIDTTAPVIISATHTQEWSNENNVEVSWTVPYSSSVKRYHYIVDQNPNTVQITSSWIATKETSLPLTDMGDGEHYVHVVWEDYAGNTGASVGNYGLQIDTTPPMPVTELHVTKSGPDINLIWTESVDTTSGVAYYQVFRSTKGGVIGRNLVKDGTVTSGRYTDAGAGDADIEYFYTIIPVDYANNSQREGNAQFSPLGSLIRIEFAIELLTELQVGETFELRLRGTDEEGRTGAISAKEVDWEITNEIAVISETGVLTAPKIGKGTIKAVLKSNPEIVTKNIVITVGAGPVITFKPVKLIINKDSLGEVKIKIDRVADFAGFEWRLSFDPQILEAVEATEGNFLKQDEGETFPVGPNIDNTHGIISFANGRITPGGVNGEGVLMQIRFKGKKVDESPLTLTNVRLSNSSGHRIIATVTPASVTVLENAPWDVNRDGLIDIFDIVIVGQNFGQEKPSDPRADINRDGQVDVTDLVLVGSHFGESAVVLAPSSLETFDSTVTPEKLIRIQQALTAQEMYK